MGVFASHIRELAGLVGAIAHEGTAEAGTTTTLQDTFLVQANDAWNGYRVYIYAGTALGQERIITDFDAATDTITWAPAGTAPSTDSKFIILHKGWTVDMLRQSIIMAMRRRRKAMLVPKVDDTITLDGSTPTYEYSVPTGFVGIQGIFRESGENTGVFIDEIPHEAWTIKKTATRKIVFNKAIADARDYIADNIRIRIIGQAYDTEPTADSDSITVSTGNLLMLAASIAHLIQAPFDVQNSEKRAALAQAMRADFEADKWQDFQELYPGSVKVEDI